MCLVGARHETAAQLKELLCLSDLSDAEVLDLNREFNLKLDKLGDHVSLNVANRIFQKQGYNLLQEFTTHLQKHFKSDAESLNFSNPEESAKCINNWVTTQTRSKITDLISPSLINDLTRLILVNAIYFKGNWCHKFDKNLTYKEDFILKDGTTQQVDMMKLTSKKFMFKINPGGLKALTCQFPYEGQSVAMTIILPHEGISIEEVETELTAECLSQVFQPDRRPTKVHAFIPKFKLEFKSEVNINITLITLECIL